MLDPSELLVLDCITTAEGLLGFTTSLLRVKHYQCSHLGLCGCCRSHLAGFPWS